MRLKLYNLNLLKNHELLIFIVTGSKGRFDIQLTRYAELWRTPYTGTANTQA